MSDRRRPARFVAALALTTVAAVAWCAPALAALDVRIVPPRGEAPVPVPLDQIDGRVNGDYVVAATPVHVEDGVSIQQLLEEIGADISYSELELPRPGGGAVLLSRPTIEAEATPPVLYTDAAGTTRFLRNGTGPGDGGDQFPVSGTLLLRQRARSTLEVTIEASRRKIDPGESVSFEASAKGVPAGASYSFHWVFDDGGTASGPDATVTHTFAKRGTRRVVVTAALEGSTRTDPSAVVEIQVGKPVEAKRDRKGGGDNDAEGAPISGDATGTGGAGRSGAAESASAASTPTSGPKPRPKPRTDPEPADVATDATVVEGSLLADAGAVPNAAVESAARAARRGAAKEEHGGVSGAALSVAVLLALLVLGAALELLYARPPRRRTRRRPSVAG